MYRGSSSSSSSSYLASKLTRQRRRPPCQTSGKCCKTTWRPTSRSHGRKDSRSGRVSYRIGSYWGMTKTLTTGRWTAMTPLTIWNAKTRKKPGSVTRSPAGLAKMRKRPQQPRIRGDFEAKPGCRISSTSVSIFCSCICFATFVSFP